MMVITPGSSEIALLAAVVKRAFDDIELRYKSSGSVSYAKKAVDWINGISLSEGELDHFMSFHSICFALGWPKDDLVRLACKLYEGEYESVKQVSSNILLSYRGDYPSDGFDCYCDLPKPESVLRDILSISPSDEEFDSQCVE